MVELAPMCGEADFDVAKTFATSQLSKCHGQELLPTGKATDAPIPVVAMNKSIKIVVGNQLKQLSENGLPAVHRRSSRGMIRLSPRKKAIFFKSFETVFASYSFDYLRLSGFLKILNRTLLGQTSKSPNFIKRFASKLGDLDVCPRITSVQ